MSINLSRLNFGVKLNLNLPAIKLIPMGACSQPPRPTSHPSIQAPNFQPFIQLMPFKPEDVRIKLKGNADSPNNFQEQRSFQQIIAQSFKIADYSLECPSHNRIKFVCKVPQCKFKDCKMCEKQECPSCGVHLSKHSIKQNLDEITTKLRKNAERYKQFILMVKQLHTKLIQRLTKVCIDYYDPFNYLGFQEKYQKLIRAIYSNHNINDFKTQQFTELEVKLLQMDQDLEHSHEFLARQLAGYNKQAQDKLYRYWNDLFKEFSLHSGGETRQTPGVYQPVSIQQPVIPAIELKININQDKQVKVQTKKKRHLIYSQKFLQQISQQPKRDLLQPIRQCNQSVLLLSEHHKFLSSSLQNPKSYELLYRGSEHKFKASVFHEKCDKVPNTLTIIRTEFGKTIAGFSQSAWGAFSNNKSSDLKSRALLLSLDLKEKMVPNDPNHLTHYQSTSGPIFGLDDIFLSDQCHINSSSYSEFPANYNKEGERKYEKSQNASKMFIGAEKGKNFKVTQYEVFRVIY